MASNKVNGAFEEAICAALAELIVLVPQSEAPVRTIQVIRDLYKEADRAGVDGTEQYADDVDAL